MEYSVLTGSFLTMTTEEMQALEFASVLHDIGKMSISTDILNKPGPLNPEEWRVIHEHPQRGAAMIQGVPFLGNAAELIMSHHERYDGEGYPNRLRGEDIPLGARVIAVADAFDTMTTDRAYRTALSVDYALRELNRCAGSQFCPIAVKTLISGLRLRATS